MDWRCGPSPTPPPQKSHQCNGLMWYLLKEKDDWDPEELNDDLGLECGHTPEVGEWKCIAGLARWKQCILVDLTDRDGWKGNICIPGAGVWGLIYLNSESISGIAATTGVTPWLVYDNPLSFSMTIHPLSRPHMIMQQGHDEPTTSSFVKSLGSSNSCNPSRGVV
jgi:hypothetical protein